MQTTTQLVVLGPHRSGTSAVTGLLVRMGAYAGPLEEEMPRNDSNPKGYHERLDVVALNDGLLACGDIPQWSTFRPELANTAARDAFEARARPVAADLIAHPVSVIKDPRMCLTFALWRPLLPNPICLMVLRNPVDVAHSLRERDGCPLVVGAAVWEHHIRQALKASEGLPRLLLDYAELVADPEGWAGRLAEQLRQLGVGGLDLGRIRGWIEPSLLHFRREEGARDELLNPTQLALYRELREGTALTEGRASTLSEGAQDALRQYRALMQLVADLRTNKKQLLEEVAVQRGRNEQIAQLDGITRELLASWRWRLGNGAVDVLRAAFLRPDLPQPKDAILRVLDELAQSGAPPDSRP